MTVSAHGPVRDIVKTSRPRVLQVITDSFSAFEFVAPLAQFLKERGVDVVIACSGRVYSDADSFVDRLRAVGLDVRDIDIPRSIAPERDVLAFAHLVQLMRSEQFDIVHTHLAKAGFVGRFAARWCGTPCVHTVYDYAFFDATGAKRAVYLQMERLAAKMCRRILFISENERDISLRYRVGRPADLKLMGFGIDLSAFDPSGIDSNAVREIRARHGISESALVAGTVGRLVPRKGVDVFLRAGAALLSRDPRYHLLVVGGGPVEAQLHDLAASLGIAKRVTFAGFAEPADVPRLMAAMDVFCLATRREGYGMVCAEAAAMERPVVASDISPVNRLVFDGETGYLVPVDDAPGFATAMDRLLADSSLRQRMGEHGARFTRANCDMRSRFDLVLKTYEELAPGFG